MLDMAIDGIATAIDTHICAPMLSAESCETGGAEEFDEVLCEWANDECSIQPTIAQAIACFETSEQDCSGNCEWKSGDDGGECVSTAFHLSQMCAGFAEQTTCTTAGNDQPGSTWNTFICEWNEAGSTCVPTQVMVEQMTCDEAADQTSCTDLPNCFYRQPDPYIDDDMGGCELRHASRAQMMCTSGADAYSCAAVGTSDNIYEGTITVGPGGRSGEIDGDAAAGYTADVRIDRNEIWYSSDCPDNDCQNSMQVCYTLTSVPENAMEESGRWLGMEECEWLVVLSRNPDGSIVVAQTSYATSDDHERHYNFLDYFSGQQTVEFGSTGATLSFPNQVGGSTHTSSTLTRHVGGSGAVGECEWSFESCELNALSAAEYACGDVFIESDCVNDCEWYEDEYTGGWCWLGSANYRALEVARTCSQKSDQLSCILGIDAMPGSTVRDYQCTWDDNVCVPSRIVEAQVQCERENDEQLCGADSLSDCIYRPPTSWDPAGRCDLREGARIGMMCDSELSEDNCNAVGASDNIYEGEITLGAGWRSGQIGGDPAEGYVLDVWIDRNSIYFDPLCTDCSRAEVCYTLSSIPRSEMDLLGHYLGLQECEYLEVKSMRVEGTKVTVRATVDPESSNYRMFLDNYPGVQTIEFDSDGMDRISFQNLVSLDDPSWTDTLWGEGEGSCSTLESSMCTESECRDAVAAVPEIGMSGNEVQVFCGRWVSDFVQSCPETCGVPAGEEPSATLEKSVISAGEGLCEFRDDVCATNAEVAAWTTCNDFTTADACGASERCTWVDASEWGQPGDGWCSVARAYAGQLRCENELTATTCTSVGLEPWMSADERSYECKWDAADSICAASDYAFVRDSCADSDATACTADENCIWFADGYSEYCGMSALASVEILCDHESDFTTCTRAQYGACEWNADTSRCEPSACEYCTVLCYDDASYSTDYTCLDACFDEGGSCYQPPSVFDAVISACPMEFASCMQDPTCAQVADALEDSQSIIEVDLAAQCPLEYLACSGLETCSTELAAAFASGEAPSEGSAELMALKDCYDGDVWHVITSVRTASDTAEESVQSGEVSTASSDLELMFDVDAAGNPVEQIVAVRFPHVPVPPSLSYVPEAHLIFQVDEVVPGDSEAPLTVLIQGGLGGDDIDLDSCVEEIRSDGQVCSTGCYDGFIASGTSHLEACATCIDWGYTCNCNCPSYYPVAGMMMSTRAAPLREVANDISMRSRTAAEQEWQPASSGVVSEEVETPDIGHIVAEIASADDWQVNNPMVFVLTLVSGSGNRWMSAEGIKLSLHLQQRSGTLGSLSGCLQCQACEASCMDIADLEEQNRCFNGCHSNGGACYVPRNGCTDGDMFVDSGHIDKHSYSNNAECSWLLECSDPRLSPQVTLERVDTEPGYDYVTVLDMRTMGPLGPQGAEGWGYEMGGELPGSSEVVHIVGPQGRTSTQPSWWTEPPSLEAGVGIIMECPEGMTIISGEIRGTCCTKMCEPGERTCQCDSCGTDNAFNLAGSGPQTPASGRRLQPGLPLHSGDSTSLDPASMMGHDLSVGGGRGGVPTGGITTPGTQPPGVPSTGAPTGGMGGGENHATAPMGGFQWSSEMLCGQADDEGAPTDFGMPYLDMVGGGSCESDPSCLGRWSGVHGPKEPLVGTDTLLLRFSSDSSITTGWEDSMAPGFSASFQCVAGPGVEERIPDCLADCAETCELTLPPEFEMVPTTTSPSSGCTYGFFSDRLKFEEAEAACAGLGGHVASIHSQADADSLRWIIESGQALPGTVWIGFTDSGTEGTFVWADDSSSDFDQWADGEPNNFNGEEDCTEANIQAFGISWNDISCNSEMPYICSVCQPPRVEQCSCLSSAACDTSSCDNEVLAQLAEFTTSDCGCAAPWCRDKTDGSPVALAEDACSGDAYEWIPGVTMGHPDFCECYPEQCVAGVGHCDNDMQCAGSLQCVDWLACSVDTLPEAAMAFAAAVDCVPDPGNPWLCAPSCCGVRCEEFVTADSCPEECHWSSRYEYCGPPQQECDTLDSQGACDQQWETCWWNGQTCEDMSMGVGACMDWTNYVSHVARRCRDAADGHTVQGGAASEQACLDAAAADGGQYEWVTDEQACLEQYPQLQWRECMIWDVENESCDPWCDSFDLDPADCNLCAEGCELSMRGDHVCHEQCNTAACETDTGCRNTLTWERGHASTEHACNQLQNDEPSVCWDFDGWQAIAAGTTAETCATAEGQWVGWTWMEPCREQNEQNCNVDGRNCQPYMRGDGWCDDECNVDECNRDRGCWVGDDLVTDRVQCEAADEFFQDPCAPPPAPPPEQWWPEDWAWGVCSSEMTDCWDAGTVCFERITVGSDGDPECSGCSEGEAASAVVTCVTNNAAAVEDLLSQDPCQPPGVTLSHDDPAMFIVLDGYQNDQECNWQVVCNSGHVPVVRFGEFETEANFDFLYFLDQSDTELDRWHGYVDTWECEKCVDGQKLYIPDDEATSTLRLKFTSDYSVLRAGFHAEAECVAAANTADLIPTLSCDDSRVQDLQGLSSPLVGESAGETDDLDLSCGSSGNEIVYTYLLDAGDKITFSVSDLTFDAKLETRVGGSCPGDMYAECTGDTVDHEYINESPVTVPVYFIVDAASGSTGTFTLDWQVVSEEALSSECHAVLSEFMAPPDQADCENGLFFEVFTPWDFTYTSFQDQDGWQHGATAGAPGWLGWVPILATVQRGDEIWYESDQDFVDRIDGFHFYDQYVLRWRGKITIAAAGLYGFKTASDDGSMLLIEHTPATLAVVVDNDGLHATREESGYLRHISLDH